MSCSLSETHRCAKCDSDIVDAIAEGRRLERAAIVADLRAMLSIARLADLRDLADRYEQRRHIKEGT